MTYNSETTAFRVFPVICVIQLSLQNLLMCVGQSVCIFVCLLLMLLLVHSSEPTVMILKLVLWLTV